MNTNEHSLPRFPRLRRVLQSTLLHPRRGYHWAIIIGILVALPTLVFGMFLDDFIHYLTMRGEHPFVGPMDSFSFTGPDMAYTIMDSGPFPWTLDPDFKARFLRPLSCVTMWLDVHLFGQAFWLYHLHSVLWYGLLLWTAGWIYRKSFPGAFGALLLLLFALDEAHWTCVAWWSNRNALIAVAPALLGLAAHLHWREDGWKPGLPLSLLGYVAGLLGGETALAVLAYALAYEVVGNRDPISKRLLCILPAALLSIAYVLMYKLLGYGVHGSGVYIDPVSEAPYFIAQIPIRFVNLSLTHFITLPCEIGVFKPIFLWPLTILGVVVLVAVVQFVRAFWPSLEAEERRALRWLMLGACLSALPVMSTAPTGRLLLVPSLGGVAVIGVVIRLGWQRYQSTGRLRWTGSIAAALIVVHLVSTPVQWVAQTTAAAIFAAYEEKACLSLELDESRLEEQHLIMLNAPDPVLAFYPMLIRQTYGLPIAEAWRPLSVSPFDHRITRTGEKSFEMEIIGGAIGEAFFEQLMRSPENAIQAGYQVVLTEMQVDVLEANEFGPTRIRFSFDRPLEDPKYHFLYADNRNVQQFTFPAMNESVVLPAAKFTF